MFSKKLSTSVLRLCDSRNLSYEAASELCGLSPRYFGSIARGKTAPTVNTLQKLCVGFDRTPNELLGFSATDGDLSYRIAMQVMHYRQHLSCNRSCTILPVCPRCHSTMEREHQAFCDCCGQKLSWDFFHVDALTPEL